MGQGLQRGGTFLVNFQLLSIKTFVQEFMGNKENLLHILDNLEMSYKPTNMNSLIKQSIVSLNYKNTVAE